MMLGLVGPFAGLLAQATTPTRVPTPSVDWWGLMPLLVLAAPAMILLHLSSLVKRFFTGFYAVYTIVVALVAAGFAVGLWWRVTSDDPGRGPFSTLHGVYGVDGFSVVDTFLLCASIVLRAVVGVGGVRGERGGGAEV